MKKTSKTRGTLYRTRWAVVVAQVVERWHSVWASRVRILGRTWLFRKCYQSILTGRRASSKEQVIKWIILFLLLSCFLSFEHCKNIICINESRKEIKNPKRGRERPIFSNLQKKGASLFCRSAKNFGATDRRSTAINHPATQPVFGEKNSESVKSFGNRRKRRNRENYSAISNPVFMNGCSERPWQWCRL